MKKTILFAALLLICFQSTILSQNNSSSRNAAIPVGCGNAGFEDGTITNWTITEGDNLNSTTGEGCCPNPVASNRYRIVKPGFDSIVTTARTNTIGTGNYVLRIGDPSDRFGLSQQFKTVKATYSYVVDANSTLFTYRYMALFVLATHSCSTQPYMKIGFTSNGNPIDCGQYFTYGPSSNCKVDVDPELTELSSGKQQGKFHQKAWTTRTFDLRAYVGQTVTLEFIASDCGDKQHGGWAYVDASCSPFTMNVNGKDIPAGQTNGVICGGPATATLCAPAGFDTFKWTGTGVTGQTGQCVNASANGSYTVAVAKTGTLCPITETLSTTLIAAPNPTATSAVTQPTCALPFGTATINATGGTSPYNYVWTPAAPSNSLNTNLNPNTSYTVVVNDKYNCSSATQFTVGSVPLESLGYTLSVLPSQSLTCKSPSTTITFAPTNSNTNVSLVGPSGIITNSTVIVSSPGTYSYAATNTVSSCSYSNTIVITENKILPTATFTTTCNTNTVTLTANSANGNLLNWTEPTTPVKTIGNPGSSTTTGIYTLTVTDAANGCVNTYTALNSALQIGIISSSITNSLTCLTPVIQATATTNSPNTTLSWSTGTVVLPTNTVSISSAGNYTAIATNPIGCTTKSVITISSNTLSNVSITAPSTVIPCNTGSVSLSATSSPSTNYSYTWLPSSPTFTGTTFTATAATIYTVTALNTLNGCKATDTKAISYDGFNTSFIADVYEGAAPLLVTFTNTSANPVGTNYSWAFGDGNTLASNSIIVNTNYVTSGTYSVVLSAKSGFCQDTAVRFIRVNLKSELIIPNVFTPNGDNKNDVFKIKSSNLKSLSVVIFDRWGLKMYEWNSIDGFWDGKNLSGNLVPEGTYYYVIMATDIDGKEILNEGKKLNGFLNLFR